MIWQLHLRLCQRNPLGIPGLDTLEPVETFLMVPTARAKAPLLEENNLQELGSLPTFSVFSSPSNHRVRSARGA